MNELDAEKIFSESGRPRLIGKTGEVREVVESCMNTARRLVGRDVPDGYVILAERQRNGRGRTGEWECPARQGILLAVILRHGLRAENRWLTGLMGAVATAETLSQFGPNVQIKWPNDLVVTRHSRGFKIYKIGGVLVEQEVSGDTAPDHILGIGINVNQDQRQLPENTLLPATSMKSERKGKALDRNEVCRKLFEKLDFWYAKLKFGKTEELLARWRTLSCLLNKCVQAEVKGERVSGEVVGVKATGELILKEKNGQNTFLSWERSTLLLS
ncbi:MAG: biotin--[acetyl-CoA-carboxylase] ligase [Planctomycetes bacterium]|nr:biotin--[acetyl-CoA-carboxylase] ligase [Planctomycetota bacterium]